MTNQLNPGMSSSVIILVGLLMSGGCSSPKPVLYPNDHLKAVGDAQVQQDIAECESFAEEHVSSSGKGKRVAKSAGVGAVLGAAAGAVGGAVFGDPGLGAAIGAASGATGGALNETVRDSGPNRTYANFVDQCLKDKGYNPVGWE